MNAPTQKIALITGGSRGLGRNTAESLARKGVHAVITYHSRADDARKVVAAIQTEGCKAVAMQLDTAATETFDGFAEQLKRKLRDTWSRDSFDFLVNNAGTGFHKDIALSRQGACPARDHGQHRRAGGDRNRFQRGTFARQPGHAAHGGASDRTGTSWCRRRYRPDDRLVAFRRQPLGQRAADRGLRRHVHLILRGLP
jgi:short chain dehydrogenase